jgi:type I restriction enzyme M protein
LEKIQAERDEAEAEVNEHTDREILHIHEAAGDLLRICSSADEAARYFTIAGTSEIEENEHNLNVPRYVDTFEPEEVVDLSTSLQAAEAAKEEADTALNTLRSLITKVSDDGVVLQ